MENIIKKAIEGGWIKSPYKFELKEIIRDETAVIRFYMEGGNYKKPFPSDSFYSFYKIVCDPLFWQALGKACEWKDLKYMGSENMDIPEWLFRAEEFYRRNLIEDWGKAVEWLNNLIKSE